MISQHLRNASRPFLAADVEAWRRRHLRDAGFSTWLAATLAVDAEVDLHALLQLVDLGCPPELAVRITAPLPREMGP